MIALKKEKVTAQALAKAADRMCVCMLIYVATLPLSLVPLGDLGSVQKYIAAAVSLFGIIFVLPVLPKIRIAPVTWVWFGFTAYIFLGMLWHPEPTKAFNVGFAMVLVFAVTALCASVSYEAKHIRRLENALAVSGIVVIGLFFVFGEKVGGQRMSLVFESASANSNQLSCYLLIPTLTLLWLVFSDRAAGYRTVCYLLTCVLSYCVLLTGSRAGLLSLGIGVFFVLLCQAFKSVKNFIFVLIMGSVLLGVMIVCYRYFLPESVTQRLTIESAVQSGGSNRVNIWMGAIDAFKQADWIKRIFGHGAESINISKMVMHNQFLQILVDMGIFGVAVYVAMLVLMGVTFVKKNKMMLCIFIALQVYSLFGSCYAYNKAFWLQWLFAAVCAVAQPMEMQSSLPPFMRARLDARKQKKTGLTDGTK